MARRRRAPLLAGMVALLARGRVARAQFAPAHACDYGALPSMVEGLNIACCTPETCTDGSAPTSCSPNCALAMASIRSGPCNDPFSRMISGGSGLSDDIEALWNTCLALSTDEIKVVVGQLCASTVDSCSLLDPASYDTVCSEDLEWHESIDMSAYAGKPTLPTGKDYYLEALAS